MSWNITTDSSDTVYYSSTSNNVYWVTTTNDASDTAYYNDSDWTTTSTFESAEINFEMEIFLCFINGKIVDTFLTKQAAEYYNKIFKYDRIQRVLAKNTRKLEKMCHICGDKIHHPYKFPPGFPEEFILCCNCHQRLELCILNKWDYEKMDTIKITKKQFEKLKDEFKTSSETSCRRMLKSRNKWTR